MSAVERLTGPRWPVASGAATATAVAAVAVLYFITGKIGLSLAFLHVSATPVWPPAGIALAALLLFGRRVWPGVFIGAFWVNITTAGSLASTFGIALGNTLEAVAAAYWVTRFAHGARAFERAQDIIKFWVAGLASAAIAATFGATSLAATGFAEWANYASLWRTWWLGDATGCFLFGSVLLVWATQPRPRWMWSRAAEVLLLGVVLVAVALMVFYGRFGQSYLALPLLLWAAFRLGTRATASAALLLCGVAIWGTKRHLGPFTGGDTNEALLELQLFMTVSTATTLVVAALVAEQRRSAYQLAHAEAAKRRQEDLRAFALEVQRAQEDERRRISRELHDGLGQRLSGLKMALQLMEDDVTDKGLVPSQALEQLSRDIDDMVVEVRRLSYNLRPAALDDFGLVAALEMLCSDFEKVHGVSVRFDAQTAAGRRDSHADIAAYRIVQEALSNVAKHASASRVNVEIRGRDDSIAVIVEDDGHGFDPTELEEKLDEKRDGSGLGMVGMKERTQLLGGRFDVRSKTGGGTRIEAELPLGRGNDEDDSHTHRG